jgi:hypothetical protein
LYADRSSSIEHETSPASKPVIDMRLIGWGDH